MFQSHIPQNPKMSNIQVFAFHLPSSYCFSEETNASLRLNFVWFIKLSSRLIRPSLKILINDDINTIQETQTQLSSLDLHDKNHWSWTTTPQTAKKNFAQFGTNPWELSFYESVMFKCHTRFWIIALLLFVFFSSYFHGRILSSCEIEAGKPQLGYCKRFNILDSEFAKTHLNLQGKKLYFIMQKKKPH